MLKLFAACVLLMGPCIVIGVFSLGLGMKFAKLQSIFLPCFFFFFGQLVFCFLSLKNIPVKVRNVIIACTMKAEIYSCNSFSSSGGLSNVVKTDYFSNFATTIISRVNDFEVIDNYMFSTNSVCTL